VGASRSASPPRSRRSESRGFTLLEILVGFTITAVLMVLLLQVLTGGLESSHRSSNEVSAVLAAQSALEELGQSVPMHDGEERTIDRDPFRITTAVRRTTAHPLSWVRSLPLAPATKRSHTPRTDSEGCTHTAAETAPTSRRTGSAVSASSPGTTGFRSKSRFIQPSLVPPMAIANP